MATASEYRKFGRENFEIGQRKLSEGSPEALRDAFRSLLEAYENYLDDCGVPGDTMRKRNAEFEKVLRHTGLHGHFMQNVLSCPEAGLIADLKPRIYGEESFQKTKEKRTDEHDAFYSAYEQFRGGRRWKDPIARLLNLFLVVRNNIQHGQKVLPEDWPEMRDRNLKIFKLISPIQHRLITLLFETGWADGLFSYGTLRSSGSLHHLVHDLVNSVENGFCVTGTLYDFGDYPGLVIGSGPPVKGEVLRSRRLHELLDRADEVEGVQFKRRLVWAHSEENVGQSLLVWVYEYAA